MWQEDKPVVRPEPQEIPSEENSGAADEVYIPDYVMPDYVMHDFGISETTRADG